MVQLLRSLRILVLTTLLLAVFGHAGAQKYEFIFEKAPFPSAHASTLVELKSGGYLAAWFGGTAEGKPDVAIWMASRSSSGWTAPVEIAREPNVPCWNPVLFYANNNRLWLYYKFGPSYTWWSAGRRFSDDDGKTWSPIEHLPAGLLGPIRTQPLLLPDGVLISGSSVESYGSWAAWIERSTDDGEHWKSSGPITLQGLESAQQISRQGEELLKPTGIIQPAVISLGGQHLRLYARSSLDIGHICIADSLDDGVTWSPARPLVVPNPNSGIDLVRLKDGRIVLVYNNTSSGRSPLNLAISEDGEHFEEFATLENGPGEFSYPAIVQGSDGNLHISYTYKRERIRYVVYPLAKIPRSKELVQSRKR
jgi:predicted neuraminidase